MEHPSDAILAAYGQGRLPLDEAARWDEHIAACEECARKLGTVETDTYSELARREPPPNAPTDPGIPDLPRELVSHDRYEIRERLGSGGMGVVYRAMHRIMRRPVALKVIQPDLVATPLAVARFRREAEAAAKLTHSNIVAAFDADQVAGVHFLVMEFIDGIDLERLVRERGPLPPAVACGLARQAARGLQHAHSQGMLHRDVKPGNLMLDGKGVVKILDFGLACWADQERPALTQAGGRLGTAQFAAPEQFFGTERVTAQADQFGLGATLFFLLTGRSPTGPSPKPDDFPPTVPAGVRDVVLRMMAFSPDDRFPSIAAAADALAPWCDDAPPGPARPNRRFLIAAGLAVIAILVSAFFWNRGFPVTVPDAAGRKVLFLLPSDGLWYEDYSPFRREIEKAGGKVIVATPQAVASRLHPRNPPGLPVSVDADLALRDVRAETIDAVVCVGYDHSEFTVGMGPVSEEAMRLLADADRAKRWIVGICAGQHVVATAGLLRDKKVCQPSEYVDNPAAFGAIPQPGRNVVVDGRILTASNPSDSAVAAKTLIREWRP